MAKQKVVERRDDSIIVWMSGYTVQDKSETSVVIPRFGIKYATTPTDAMLHSASADDWINIQAQLRKLGADAIIKRMDGQIVQTGVKGLDAMSKDELIAYAADIQRRIDALSK